jgi:hypothetical protein
MTQPTKEEAQKFEEEYNELCKKHGLMLISMPQWKLSQDTGTFSMVLVPMISRIPEA